jgi:hypothetical protein
VETAKDSEIPMVPVLPNAASGRGFAPSVTILDRGYDTESLHALLEERDIRRVIPLRMTPAVKRAGVPTVRGNRRWAFAGSDAKRHATMYSCPTGEGKPRLCGSRPGPDPARD